MHHFHIKGFPRPPSSSLQLPSTQLALSSSSLRMYLLFSTSRRMYSNSTTYNLCAYVFKSLLWLRVIGASSYSQTKFSSF